MKNRKEITKLKKEKEELEQKIEILKNSPLPYRTRNYEYIDELAYEVVELEDKLRECKHDKEKYLSLLLENKALKSRIEKLESDRCEVKKIHMKMCPNITGVALQYDGSESCRKALFRMLRDNLDGSVAFSDNTNAFTYYICEPVETGRVKTLNVAKFDYVICGENHGEMFYMVLDTKTFNNFYVFY